MNKAKGNEGKSSALMELMLQQEGKDSNKVNKELIALKDGRKHGD